MSNGIIITERMTGDDIMKIIANVEPILEGEKRSHAYMALIALALIILNPDLDGDQLQEAITSTSQFMCLAVTPPDTPNFSGGTNPSMSLN